MLAQINDIPQFEAIHFVWIAIGLFALFVIIITAIQCKKVTPVTEKNDPQNEEIKKLFEAKKVDPTKDIMIKNTYNVINCTAKGEIIYYNYQEALDFSSSHPYFRLKYKDEEFWRSSSEFFWYQKY